MDIEPSRTSAMLGTAWLLATAPDAAVRNGAEALRLAEEANTPAAAGDANTADVLAAAYAEQGDFARASEFAARALQLARERSTPALATAIRSRTMLYAQKKPYRETQNSAAAEARRTGQSNPVQP
jgi:hypothetical protein